MTIPDDHLYLFMEKRLRERHDKVREIIRDMGGPAHLADYDNKMKRIQTGEYGAGSIWQSISEAQRRALVEINAGTWTLKPVTMRCLLKRNLAHWDGPAPKLTEHGAFVLKFGPKQPRI